MDVSDAFDLIKQVIKQWERKEITDRRCVTLVALCVQSTEDE